MVPFWVDNHSNSCLDAVRLGFTCVDRVYWIVFKMVNFFLHFKTILRRLYRLCGISNAASSKSFSIIFDGEALATMDSIWSSTHRCKQRHKRPRYKTPVAYYSNSIAIQRLVQTATSSTQKSKEKTNAKRNITKFDCCEKTIRRNQASITCCGCIGSFLKCSGLTASSYTWLCSNCLGFALPFYKCSEAEMLDDTLDLSASLDPGLDIHPLCSNSGQLKIMHLYTQSMVSTFNELYSLSIHIHWSL